MDSKPTAYLGARACIVAIRSVIAERTKGTDPAPWYVASPAAMPGDNETPNVWEMAIYERANLTFFRAMLSGSLQGWFVDGVERWKIPGWAWTHHDGDWRALIEGNDFVHPLAPAELRRWGWHPVLVEQDAFELWLGGFEVEDQSGFPNLPAAHDADLRRADVTHQLPPPRPNVSLAHAVSWLAFGISLDAETLTYALRSDALGESPSDTQQRLEAATDLLLTAGTGGLPFIGRFVRAGGDYDTPLTEPIPSERLEDFRLFDVGSDGLRFGNGVQQHRGDHGNFAFRRTFLATTQRYVDVKVERRSLMTLAHDPNTMESKAAFAFRDDDGGQVIRKGRTPGSGSLALHDAPLVLEMRQLIEIGTALSVNAAATIVAERARGSGTFESKVSRLSRAYRRMERNREL